MQILSDADHSERFIGLKKEKTRLNCEAERCSSRPSSPFCFFFSPSPLSDDDDDVFPALLLCSIPNLFDLDEVGIVELELALGPL